MPSGKNNGNFKHGLCSSMEYRIWQGMIGRCYNKNHKKYYRYGARGISVCSRWRNSFTSFYKDMGPVKTGYSIDRINNNGNYESGNCRWANQKEQQNNRGNNRKFMIKNKEYSVTQLAALYNISSKVIIQRVDRDGMSIEHALSRSTNRVKHTVKYKGKKLNLRQLANYTGLSYEVIYGRFKLGWPTKKIITIPFLR